MKLSRLSVERPVFATVVNLLLVVLGVAAATQLPVRQYPDIDPPTVSVSASYTGASAEIVETQITRVIEDAVAGIEGVKLITSASRDESSQVTIEFELGRDIDFAAADVREQVATAVSRLPSEVDAPIVRKASADSSPMLWISLRSEVRDQLELTDLVRRELVDAISVVPGVARVIIGGERRYSLRVWIDPLRLAAVGLEPGEVVARLRAENLEFPAGRIESQTRELTIRATTRLREPEDFAELTISARDGRQIRLGDVARIEIAAVNERSGVWANGQPAVGMGIIRQSTANTLEVGEGVRARMETLRASLPSDVIVAVPYDESVFIAASVDEVISTLFIALILVVAVILFFLRSVRATIAPAVAIPISILAAALPMLLFGFSINVLTLLAMVLAIGLVVDDAIVVLENIHRRLELGERPLVAAVRGVKEVGLAIVATTAVLVAVFLPVAFQTDDTGRLFGEFGVSLAVAVMFSSFVALTLVPMVCARVLRAHEHHGTISTVIGNGLGLMERGYRWILHRALRVPTVILIVALALAVAGGALFTAVPRELAPTEDQGLIIVFVNGPEGATAEYTLGQVDELRRRVIARAAGPDAETGDLGPIEAVLAIVAPAFAGAATPNRAFMLVRMKNWADRSIGQESLRQSLFPDVMGLPGVSAFPGNRPPFNRRGFGQPVQIAIMGPTIADVEEWSELLSTRLQDEPALANVRVAVDRSKPQLRLAVDRDRAADLGLSVADIGDAIQILMGSLEASRWEDRGEEYDVIVQAEEQYRADPAALDRIFLRGGNGELVPLSSVVERSETGTITELPRLDRRPSLTVEGSLAPGVSMGVAVDRITAIANEVLPPEARTAWQGQSKEFVEGSGAIYYTFALALIVVYLVLAAQFESWIHPLVILCTVPLGIGGAFAALWVGGMLGFAGASNNIYAQIGAIMLIGLMAKNGILLVEFANQLRDRGLAVPEAIREAAAIRLRPILMTVISTVAGAIPLVLTSGAGAEGRQAIGLVIVGGMTLASVLTLFVVPALYQVLAPFAKPASATADRLRDEEASAQAME